MNAADKATNLIDEQFEDLFPNPLEKFDSAIERHDLYTFEAKLDYFLERKIPINKYDLNIFFFIPSALQINKNTYPKERFFADLTDYMRFKTPPMALFGIINEHNSLSPMYKINQNLTHIKNGKSDPELIDNTQYELRLLGAIIKSSIRDQFQYFMKEIRSCLSCSEIIPELEQYLVHLCTFQEKMYAFGREFLTVQIETRLREAFSFVDEYLSFQIERRLAVLLKLIDKVEELKVLKNKVIHIIEDQQKHRKNVKSKLIPLPDNDNESFSYWDGIFKKYTQGILYLDLRTKDEKSKALQLLYSIAAGVAMFLSLLIGLWVAGLFEENSMSFIFALAVAYIFKDRIKESIRAFSNNAVRVLFADKKYDLYDNITKKKIGECKSNVNFVNWKDVPPEVLNIRESSNKFSIEHEGKPEVVMKMKKTTVLYTDQIEKYHERHCDIHDLFRFNIKHFIQYADDPFNIEYSWIPELGRVEEIHCAKVYHLNIVFKMQIYYPHKDCKIFYKKVRVIMDQQGIKRVEEPEYRV